MGVSGSPQVRSARSNSKNSRRKRAGPSSESLDEKTLPDNSSGEVEVEVAKKNMKVSSEAWKAFQVYQKYEDWASETEKTDYTYSRLSNYHHKEVIPGFPVRPNLCRSPIKPSSPTSAYDYSSEREHLQNLSNAARSNCRPRKLVLEDTVDTIETVEQVSLYRRLVESLLITWISIKASSSRTVERLGVAVQRFSAIFAGVFISIWASTAAASSSVGASIHRGWNSLFTRQSEAIPQESEVATEGSRYQWLTENSATIWMRSSIHTVVTTVTTFYYQLSKSEASATRRKYLWLLLLPLLLLAGWWSVSDNTKDNIVPFVSSAGSHILRVWASTLEAISGLYEATLQVLSRAWYMFYGFLLNCGHILSTLLSDSGSTLLNYLSAIFLNVSDIVQTWFRWIAAATKEGAVLIFEKISGSFMDAASFVWLFNNHTEYYVDDLEVPRLIVADNPKNEPKAEELEDVKKVDETADIAEILQRIAELETRLQDEKSRRVVEEEKIEAALKNYHMILQRHQAGSDAALRRCCRWPCPSIKPAPPTQPIAVSAITEQDVHRLVAGIRKQTAADIASLRAELSDAVTTRESFPPADGSFDMREVRRIVAEAIKLYDADKTGLADYALESAGGRVVSIRCTKAYSNKGYPAWGFPVLWTASSSPEDAIRPGTAPGECWAFQGSVGYLALELSYSVKVTGFTMEHIASALSPSGSIDSAPKHFSMWGLKHADDLYEQYLFGEYVYQDSGETVQYFPVKNPTDVAFKFVELKIVSNHGHPDYTCLYRIRVHGTVT